MRTIIAVLCLALLASAPASEAQPMSPGRWKSELEREAAPVLGAAGIARVRAARSAVLVRGPVSFPYTVRQPDGSYRPQRPAFAAAVRMPDGWVRLSGGNRRDPFDPAAGRELDRLLAGRALWSEPSPDTACTDPSGSLLLLRHLARERALAFPCGFAGLAGQVAQIVLAGGITDWTGVPAAQRPSGLPLSRFEDAVASRFRHQSGLYDERLMTIRRPAEWLGQWRRLTTRHSGTLPLPAVDFSREMLLMAGMGPRPSGGYRAVIEKVVEQSGELLAFVRFVSPGRRCGAIAAMTSPVDIVRLPTSSKNVRWVVEREVADCP